MIHISNKHDCCGCAACVQICPKQCISFDEDEQGFRYPVVLESLCVNCGLCEKVCPVINQAVERKPIKVYAAQNPNEEIRFKSSSGGIFTILAEKVIEEGGVVFGAQFDVNWEVEHAYTETREGLEAFRGSKYLQSRTGDTYKQTKEFLKSGRKVLYSGTSCQIAGLKKFLRHEYENLITIDVVCHGVPSPLVWRTYLDDFKYHLKGRYGRKSACLSLNDMPIITGVFFRDKTTGWKKFGLKIKGKTVSRANNETIVSSVNTNKKHDVLLHETLDKNLFMQVFLNNLCLRPSCSVCPAKSGKCGSDITLADYWGIWNHHSEWDDDKGTSLVLINSIKGINIYNSLLLKQIETSYEEGLLGNICIEHSVEENEYVPKFWNLFLIDQFSRVSQLLSNIKPNILQRIISRIKALIYR